MKPSLHRPRMTIPKPRSRTTTTRPSRSSPGIWRAKYAVRAATFFAARYEVLVVPEETNLVSVSPPRTTMIVPDKYAWFQAPDCPVAEHVACAGLDDPPTTDWYCTEHRNKPSLKRKRARSAAKDAAAFVRRSAEPRPSPPRKSTGAVPLQPASGRWTASEDLASNKTGWRRAGRIGKGATAEDDPGKRGTTKRRR